MSDTDTPSPPICSTCADTRKVHREFQPGAYHIERCPDCDPAAPPVPWPWGDVQRRMAADVAVRLVSYAHAVRGVTGDDLRDALAAARIALDLSERR